MVRAEPRAVKLRIPGSTSNLGAAFDTAGLALQIYLTVDAEPAKKLSLHIRGEGETQLPPDRTNLIYQTYRKACDHFSLPIYSFAIRVENDIPLQRGLGSSGAAIAAGLKLAQVQAGGALPESKLLTLGCEIEGHPENVLASYLGGFCVSCFDGKSLAYKRFVSLPS